MCRSRPLQRIIQLVGAHRPRRVLSGSPDRANYEFWPVSRPETSASSSTKSHISLSGPAGTYGSCKCTGRGFAFCNRRFSISTKTENAIAKYT